MADIHRTAGDEGAASESATKAFQAAWCDGPPYAYHWGLERARAHLTALNAPAPELPPLDESTLEPMLEVDLNPKDENWIDPDTLE